MSPSPAQAPDQVLPVVDFVRESRGSRLPRYRVRRPALRRPPVEHPGGPQPRPGRYLVTAAPPIGPHARLSVLASRACGPMGGAGGPLGEGRAGPGVPLGPPARCGGHRGFGGAKLPRYGRTRPPVLGSASAPPSAAAGPWVRAQDGGHAMGRAMAPGPPPHKIHGGLPPQPPDGTRGGLPRVPSGG
jgi:hypothetical protein